MKILAIDTSGLQAGAAIVSAADSSSVLVGEIFLNARTGVSSGDWTHSEILMPGVAQIFELVRVAPEEITHVAYTSGPGSFTGLRIGAACALGFARGLGVGAIAIPTLDALAYNMKGFKNFVVPMLDARRGQVYFSVFCGERLTDYLALPVSDALETLLGFTKHDAEVIFLGDGADANADAIREKFPCAIFPHAGNNRQRAASVGLLAAEKILAGEEFSEKVEILYVRAPQAVREREKNA